MRVFPKNFIKNKALEIVKLQNIIIKSDELGYKSACEKNYDFSKYSLPINEEKNINNQIFKEYFNYQILSFLTKDLYEDNQIKNDRIVKHLNESFIH